MGSKQQVEALLQDYLQIFENEDQHKIQTFLKENDELYNRKNFNGHITASAFIVDKNYRQLLLLKHKLYDRFLQPGGHIEDGDESILKAALREASEETGIPEDQLKYQRASSNEKTPLDIDSHPIPANAVKQEAAHIHHDVRYLFVYEGDKNIHVPPTESKEARWINLDELDERSIFSLVSKKILQVTKRFTA